MTKQEIPNWKVRNEYAFLVSFAVGVFTFAGLYFSLIGEIRDIQKDLKYISQNQQELKQDFKSWKSQAETRLGTIESRQNQIISYLESNLKVIIK